MSKTWKDLLDELEVAAHLPDDVSIDKHPLCQKFLDYLEGQPIKTVMECTEDLTERFKNLDSGNANPVLCGIFVVLLYHFTPERQFVLVKVCLKHLAEELDMSIIQNIKPVPPWHALWCFFAANKMVIQNLVQVRQLRSLAKKLITTHTHYLRLPFIDDQLVCIPEKMKISRLERIKWFREIKKPKWLNS